MPSNMNIIPTINAMIAFNLGPPGALINRAKLGFKRVAAPKTMSNNPPKIISE